MITKIELNPKDIEQKGDMNSNCDWDCDQVIGFGEILTELLKLDLLDGPNTNKKDKYKYKYKWLDWWDFDKYKYKFKYKFKYKYKYKYKCKWLDWWDFDWIIEVGFVGGSKYK